jgi:integrase
MSIPDAIARAVEKVDSAASRLEESQRGLDTARDALDARLAAVGWKRAGPFHEIDRAMWLTAAMTGLRKGELVALRWRDIDWSASRIRVRQNYVRGQFGSPKSRRSTRSVPMADEVGGALDRLLQGSPHTGPDDLVFAHPATGGPMTKANITRRYRKALRDAQLDDHVFHDLRHTFGTRMAAVGTPLRTLQEWMGHRDITTTQRYADYMPSGGEADLIAAAFARDTRGSVRGSNLIASQPTSADLKPPVSSENAPA